MMELNELFLRVKDGRRKDGQRYPLHSFLWMVFLSVCSGHNSSRSISKFMKSHSKFFILEFGLKHGLPSHVTVNQILKATDSKSMRDDFNAWASAQPLSKYDWLSGDGQWLGSTLSNAHDAGQNMISVVSWFIQRTGTVYLMDYYRSKKGNEADIVREMLSDLKGKGLIITLDALHCQKKLQS